MKTKNIRVWMNNNKIVLTKVMFACIYLAILLPYLFSIFHSIPTSDDFCMTLNGEPHLIGCLSYTWDKYLNWSGEFICTFLQYFINPLAYSEIGSFSYGITLCFFFLLFIISYRYFIRAWLEELFDISNRLYIEVITIILVSILIFANNYHEIFYWFTGAFYELEYALAFGTIGCMIKYYGKKGGNRVHFAALMVMGILACNAVNMCVIIAMSYIYTTVWYLIRAKKKIEAKIVIPLASYILMGCITVFAPGNFSRKGSGDYSAVVKAIFRAFSCNVRHMFNLFENNIVFFLFIVVFLMGLTLNIKIKKKVNRIWVLLPLLAICLYGVLLPVAIGYGEATILNNRVCFLLDAVMIPILEIYVFGLGMHVSEKTELECTNKEKVIYGVIFVCLFYSIVIMNDAYCRCEYINQISNFENVQKERELWVGIYNDILNYPEKDVEIVVPDEIVVKSGVIENPALDENPNFWINSEICRYFKKNSISVVLNE